MPPRKRTRDDGDVVAEPVAKRRSSRQASIRKADEKDQVSVDEVKKAAPAKKRTASAKESKKESVKKTTATTKSTTTADDKKTAKKGGKAKAKKGEEADEEDIKSSRAVSEDPDIDSLPTVNPEAPRHDGEWYWLMKAEPETRLENGIDVRFSIDDLRSREKPEGWDGEFSVLL